MEHTNQPIEKDHHLPFTSIFVFKIILNTPWKISMEHTNQPIEKDHHLPFTSIFVFKIILNTPWKISMEHTNQPIEKDHHLPFTSIFVFKIILNTVLIFQGVGRQFLFPRIPAPDTAVASTAAGRFLKSLWRRGMVALHHSTILDTPGKFDSKSPWNHGNLRYPPLCHPPQKYGPNKALLRETNG